MLWMNLDFVSCMFSEFYPSYNSSYDSCSAGSNSSNANIVPLSNYGIQLPPSPTHRLFKSFMAPSNSRFSSSRAFSLLSNSLICDLAWIKTSVLLALFSPFPSPPSFGNFCARVSNWSFRRSRYFFSTSLWFVRAAFLIDLTAKLDLEGSERGSVRSVYGGAYCGDIIILVPYNFYIIYGRAYSSLYALLRIYYFMDYIRGSKKEGESKLNKRLANSG